MSLNQDAQNNQNIMNALQQIVELASEMREILNECRYEQINMTLAKRIDNVLKKATYMD